MRVQVGGGGSDRRHGDLLGGPPDRGLLDPQEQVVDIDPLPPAVAAALAVAADSRSDVQEQSLENYLRATTPLLAEARRDLSRARAQRAAFRESLLAPGRIGR